MEKPNASSNVVFGKPMKKLRASFLQENAEGDELAIGAAKKHADLPEKSSIKEPKALLELAQEIKPGENAEPPSIGADKRLLMSALTSAKSSDGVQDHLSTWRPYSYVSLLPEEDMETIRKHLKIIVEGSNIPPLSLSFHDMRLNSALCKYISDVKKISSPSLIQMQGIPAALAGRDLIGIASTGSGKTLAFCIPLVLHALAAELKMEIVPGEGPVSLILAPSRELARQTYQQCVELAECLSKAGFPNLNTVNLIGGLPMGDQISQISKGVHVVVGTTGRTLDFLNKGHVSLHACRHICLDEADRMIDLGFEEELRGILAHGKSKMQMLLFSATMPDSIKNFAMKALSDPILVNVGRAGAANLNIVQEVELVDKTKRLNAVLQALQKTGPSVLIFASNKSGVDDVLEFLLLKGIEAVAIHGGKTQEERNYAIDSFKSGKKDVLVANDIASKGLDLQNIKHVINFDMPNEIEDYIHRIGRTGRGGCTGIATTFVDPTCCSEAVMLDLKHILAEANQFIPPFLVKLGEGDIARNPCSICGGLGHGIDKCPKIGTMASKQLSNIRNSEDASEY